MTESATHRSGDPSWPVDMPVRRVSELIGTEKPNPEGFEISLYEELPGVRLHVSGHPDAVESFVAEARVGVARTVVERSADSESSGPQAIPEVDRSQPSDAADDLRPEEPVLRLVLLEDDESMVADETLHFLALDMRLNSRHVYTCSRRKQVSATVTTTAGAAGVSAWITMNRSSKSVAPPQAGLQVSLSAAAKVISLFELWVEGNPQAYALAGSFRK